VGESYWRERGWNLRNVLQEKSLNSKRLWNQSSSVTISVQKIAHWTEFLQYSDYIEREDRTFLYPVFRNKRLQIGLATKKQGKDWLRVWCIRICKVRTYQTDSQLPANLTVNSTQCRPVHLISVSAILLAGYRIVIGISKINYNILFNSLAYKLW